MSLKDKSVLDLMMKKQVLGMIIRDNPDDPRVGEPKRQLAIIEEELKLRKENEKPQNYEDEKGNLTVGLKALKMTSSSKLGT